ncbi:hypothetical protein C9994_03380 [Marivirga lumbricoides]|uniref:Uncharacterized protein n=1 Tax=Marivirga lumbricoides TaxID=1046115 RepID=A0A2T4DU52_9BACT|nr:hypothetical protein C9994_03380 [Marivirga lumbricoides]
MKYLYIFIFFFLTNVAYTQILDKLELFSTSVSEDQFSNAKNYIRMGSRLSISDNKYEIQANPGNTDNPVVFKFSELSSFSNAVRRVTFQRTENITITNNSITRSSNSSPNISFDVIDPIPSDFTIKLIDENTMGKIERIEFLLKDADRLILLNRIRNLESNMELALNPEERVTFQNDLSALTNQVTTLQNIDTDQQAQILRNRYSEILRMSNNMYDNLSDAHVINTMGDAMNDIVLYLTPSSSENFSSLIESIVNNLRDSEKKDRVLDQLDDIKNNFVILENQLASSDRVNRGFDFLSNTLNIVTGGRFTSIINVGKSFLSLFSSKNNAAEESLGKAYKLIITMEEKAQKLRSITGQFSGVGFEDRLSTADSAWANMFAIVNEISAQSDDISNLQQIYSNNSDQETKSITQKAINHLSNVMNNSDIDNSTIIQYEAQINSTAKELNESIFNINTDLTYLKNVLEQLSTEIGRDLSIVTQAIEDKKLQSLAL